MFPSASNILITGGSYTQHLNVDNRQIQPLKGGFERLQEASAPGAFHNSGERFDPPKCHPNTRVAVLKRIMGWILRQDPSTRDRFIMWIYGAAGAGKSAIAQTLAEMCYSKKKLLASFFFSKSDPLRRTAQALVATLAYQLALTLPPQVRQHITSIVEHDPLIFTRSLEAQFEALIAHPVQRLAESGFFTSPYAPLLLIIDGLDECEDSRVQCNILNVIFKSSREQNLPLLFLIASRPERDISSSFDSQPATSTLARLALDVGYLAYDDIRLFLVEKFEEIKQTHPLRSYIPVSWPTSEVVGSLVHKSSGQFIYASTVMKFVESARHRPTDRLDVILGIRPASSETPFAELDALYSHIFSTVNDIERVLAIVGFIIFSPPEKYFFTNMDDVMDDDLESFLTLNPGDLSLILGDLGSLISIGPFQAPRILHASLKDFLTDEFRSQHLYINPAEKHTQYALICFKICFKMLENHRLKPQLESFPHPNTFGRLFYHCRNSMFTEELKQSIVQFASQSVMDRIKFCQDSRSGILDWIFDIATPLLESLPWDKDQQLYNYYKEYCWDRLMTETISEAIRTFKAERSS